MIKKELQECLNCTELKKRIAELEGKVLQLEGWKGKDAPIISRDDDFWTVIEHRKDKVSLQVKDEVHHVPHSNVLFMASILKDYADAFKNKPVAVVKDDLIHLLAWLDAYHHDVYLDAEKNADIIDKMGDGL